MNKQILNNNNLNCFHILNPPPSIHHKDPGQQICSDYLIVHAGSWCSSFYWEYFIHSDNSPTQPREWDTEQKRWRFPSLPLGNFIISNFRYIYVLHISLASPVDVPLNGAEQNYDGPDQREEFTYANVRRTSYRGTQQDNDSYSNYSDHQHDFSVQDLGVWRNLPKSVR